MRLMSRPPWGACQMRRFIFFMFVVVGAAVGPASALTDDGGMNAVMMTIGADHSANNVQ